MQIDIVLSDPLSYATFLSRSNWRSHMTVLTVCMATTPYHSLSLSRVFRSFLWQVLSQLKAGYWLLIRPLRASQTVFLQTVLIGDTGKHLKLEIHYGQRYFCYFKVKMPRYLVSRANAPLFLSFKRSNVNQKCLCRGTGYLYDLYSNAIYKYPAIWLVDVIKFATIKNCINPLG